MPINHVAGNTNLYLFSGQMYIHHISIEMNTLNRMNLAIQPYMQNQWVIGLLTMILIVYGSYAQQTLPDFMYRLFDNRLFNFIVFSLIVFIGIQNWTVAFVIALIYAVIMHNFSQKKINEAFMSGLKSLDMEN